MDARIAELEEALGRCREKCKQYYNATNLCDAEIHAAFGWIHDVADTALRAAKDKDPMKTPYAIYVEGRLTVRGEIVGHFGLRKPDPKNWWDAGPDIQPTDCPHDLWEVTHLPTGARVGMFRDEAVARQTIARYDAVEGIGAGTFGDGYSAGSRVLEKLREVFIDVRNTHGGDAVRWN